MHTREEKKDVPTETELLMISFLGVVLATARLLVTALRRRPAATS
jgi:hypothetical protein